jgi:DNA mismatch endonuclease (patch repair protein)
MARVRTRDTAPEMAVRSVLHRAGFRFLLHDRRLPGTPDIVLPRLRLAIFVHGCFWHGHSGCPRAKAPATRAEFWRDKLARNAERDRAAAAGLALLGWRTLTVWGCEATADAAITARLAEALDMGVGPDGGKVRLRPKVARHASRSRRSMR